MNPKRALSTRNSPNSSLGAGQPILIVMKNRKSPSRRAVRPVRGVFSSLITLFSVFGLRIRRQAVGSPRQCDDLRPTTLHRRLACADGKPFTRGRRDLEGRPAGTCAGITGSGKFTTTLGDSRRCTRGVLRIPFDGFRSGRSGRSCASATCSNATDYSQVVSSRPSLRKRSRTGIGG